MRTHQRHAKSLSLKIFPINPYYSEILVVSSPQVRCFHRPEGEGVSPDSVTRRTLQQHAAKAHGTHNKEQGSTRVLPCSPLLLLGAPGSRPFAGRLPGILAYLLESLDFISACEVSPLSDSAYFLPPKRI
jgi:hypothetical protein